MDGRIAVLRGAREPFELRSYPIPDPEPGAILIRVTYANVCGSDLHIWRGEMPLPAEGRPIGHEMTGRVAALGRGVTTDSLGQPLAEGDRLVYNYFFPCGRCPACLRGNPGACPSKSRSGGRGWRLGDPPYFTQAFGDYYYLPPGHVAVKVPDDLPDALVAPLNCALCQVIHGLLVGGFQLGDTLVVQGAGGLGLNLIAVARDLGASTIIAIDGIPGRLKLARAFGADQVIDIREHRRAEDRIALVKKLTGGYGALFVADVAGIRGVVAEGLAMLGSGGTYLEIGSIVAGLEFQANPQEWCSGNKRMIGFAQYDPRLIPRALDFLRRNRTRFPFDRIISHTYPLEAIDDAFRQAEWLGRQPEEALITRAAVTP